MLDDKYESSFKEALKDTDKQIKEDDNSLEYKIYLQKLYELRKQRKAKGLCVSCGKSMDREGYYCNECNEKYNEYKHNHVCKYHTEGKCVNCGKEIDRQGWFCCDCAQRLKLRARKRSAYRRANGLCVQCGEPTALGSYCQRCRDMRMERYRRKKEL